MSEDLQGLLNKIQSDGLKKAEDEKAKIIGAAQEQAAKIVSEAKNQAAEIIKNAQSNAVAEQKKAESAIRQASRDILISLKTELLARLQVVTKDCAGKAMTPELMGNLIAEMAKGYRAAHPAGTSDMEVIVGKKDADAMAQQLKSALLTSLKVNPKLTLSNDFGAGFQIGFTDEDVYLDFSDEALTEIIGDYVGPKLSAVIKG